MVTQTTNYDFDLPAVNDPTDEDLWGGYLNGNWTSLDSLLAVASDNVTRSETSSTVATTVADQNKLLLMDCTSNAITVNLVAAATAGDGFTIIIKKSDSTTNQVTIDGNASETIDGATTLKLASQYDAVALVCDGSNWHVKDRSLSDTGNNPAFQANYDGGTLAISGATDTKVPCNTEDFDTNSCYDNATNYRFTPLVAGEYMIYGQLFTNSTSGKLFIRLKKNGTVFADYVKQASTDNSTVQVSKVVTLNGSTDYVEMFVRADVATTLNNSQADVTWFGGYKIAD